MRALSLLMLLGVRVAVRLSLRARMLSPRGIAMRPTLHPAILLARLLDLLFFVLAFLLLVLHLSVALLPGIPLITCPSRGS